MAAPRFKNRPRFVPIQRNNYVFEEDRLCRYSIYSRKPDGKIACLALGEDGGEEVGDIVGITFQKASDASIKPVLPSDRFTDVIWQNAPTRLLNQQAAYIDIDAAEYAPPAPVPKPWQDFADTMRQTKQFILSQVQPQQDTLLKTFQKLNLPSLLEIGDLVQYVAEIGENWTRNDFVGEFAKETILKGCYGSPASELKNLCKFYLYQNAFTLCGSINLVIARQSSSGNSGIPEGVVNCLNYGYHKKGDEVDEDYESDGDESEVDDESEHKVSQVDDESRGRARKRIILPKRKGQRSCSRSRSRSPVSDDDEIDIRDNIVDITNPHRPHRRRSMRYLFANHDDFYLRSDEYIRYFEAHTPDMICYNNTDQNEKVGRVIFEIASWNRESDRDKISLNEQARLATEQCVQSTLACLAHNQDSILGVVLVTDGMRVIQVTRRQSSYQVEETPLVCWDEEDRLFRLLEMIRKAILLN